MRRTIVLFAITIAIPALTASAWAAPRLPTEPAEISPGQKVLVDDGTCPGGQIKELTGGFPLDRKTGQPKPGDGHSRRCIKR